MGNINTLRSDLDKQVNGTWFPYEAGIEMKIARWGNERFLVVQRELVEQRKVVLNAKELTEEQRLDVNKEAASRAILLDWRNLDNDTGPVPYTPAQALAFFRDPELQALWSFVLIASVEEANFRKTRLEADLKKLIDVLTWQLEWGPQVGALKIRAEKGLPTPAWDGRPVLPEELEWVLEGFWVLSQSRPGGGWGLSPIGMEAIKAYLDLIQVNHTSSRLEFLELVLTLDREFLRWSTEHGERSRSHAEPQG